MAWFCYVLALFSKENAVVFPFLFLLLEFTETEGNLHSLAEPNRLRFLAGLLICTAIFFYVRFYALQSAGELGLPRLGGSIPHTLVATTKIFAFYLLLFFCPFQMRALYPTSMYSTEMDAAFFVSFAALFILVAFLIYFRREKIFVFGMLWWFVALLPVSNLHPLFNPMAERYLFLPSIGLCLWVGWLIGTAYEKGRRGFLLGATGVLALFLSTLTFLRNPDWRDNLKLWGVAADRDPENPRILANLAAAHYQAGNYVKAIVSARRALKELKVSHETVNPGSLYLCIGSAFFMRGDLAEALESMKRAEPYLPVRFDSDFSLYRTLGLIYDAKGQLRNALAEYRNAADINPFRAELWRKIAFCELRLGRREQAMEDWEKARVLDRTVPRFDEIETLYKTSHYRPAE
jgi:tetratricopeptide (TPR) repeat protein